MIPDYFNLICLRSNDLWKPNSSRQQNPLTINIIKNSLKPFVTFFFFQFSVYSIGSILSSRLLGGWYRYFKRFGRANVVSMTVS